MHNKHGDIGENDRRRWRRDELAGLLIALVYCLVVSVCMVVYGGHA